MPIRVCTVSGAGPSSLEVTAFGVGLGVALGVAVGDPLGVDVGDALAVGLGDALGEAFGVRLVAGRVGVCVGPAPAGVGVSAGLLAVAVPAGSSDSSFPHADSEATRSKQMRSARKAQPFEPNLLRFMD